MAEGRDLVTWDQTSVIASMALNSRGAGFNWVEPKTLNPTLRQPELESKPKVGHISELRGLVPTLKRK
jgi:hypothetical protein